MGRLKQKYHLQPVAQKVDMHSVAQKVGMHYMRRIGAPHQRGRQSDGSKSVCVHGMMINNRGTSLIRRPPAPSPPSPLLPTRRSSGRPLDYALEASARVSSFEPYCHRMTRSSIWRGREESPQGHNIEK